MPRNSFVKLWMDKIIGTATETADSLEEDPIPSTSTGGYTTQSPRQPKDQQESVKSSIQSSPSSFSSNSTSSKESFTRASLEGLVKHKIPNVLRTTTVDSKFQIIPPLPRLYLGDNTADKLSRILTKIDSMTLESEEVNQLASVAPPTNKAKYE